MSGYLVNEVFYSVQGEGVLAGTPMVFVRLSKCNMRCAVEAGPKSPGGFDCDTEFESGTRVTGAELLVMVASSGPKCRRCGCTEYDACFEGCWWSAPGLCSTCSARDTIDGEGAWVLLTGGEPGLQVDLELCAMLRQHNFRLAIETNGSIALPNYPVVDTGGGDLEEVLEAFPFDHITVSPKVAEHAIRQRYAHELRYVRGYGQGIPETGVRSLAKLISPACHGDAVDRRAVEWCVELVKENPEWRLSVQMHKEWLVR